MTASATKSDLWRQIREIYEETASLPMEQRKDYLDLTCTGKAEVRKEVEAMLQAETTLGSFLEPPRTVDGTIAGDQTIQLSGKTLGPYHIERLLGEGGMAAVFLGVRSYGQYQKKVAVKVVRSGLWSKAILGRFEHEREALARLDHPNIGRLVDVGTTEEGLPYVVMEYVDGVPIDEYCNAKGLSIPDRLRLFSTICGAVHYAHQNLIVHRDLKPGNILVARDGTPKLLDFGIAKILGDAQTEEPSELTQPGFRFITPEYASPEQLRGEAITTATDIYSLGVILFKLLTGERPYTFRSHLPHEITRIVCEQSPSKPSTAVVKFGDRQDKDKDMASLRVGGHRSNITPEKLQRLLSGDLDTIVLRALHKDPQRRYPSVLELSEDIRRHLLGLPISAHSDAMGYLVGKFVRRHKIGVISVAVVILTLVGGLIGTLWQAKKAQDEAARVLVEKNKVDQINSFLQEMLSSADPARSGKDVTVAQTLDQAVVRANQELLTQPEIAAAVLHTIGETYVALGLYDKASTQIERSLAIRHEVLGAEHEDISTSLHSLAYVAQVTRDFTKADSLYQRAIAMHNKVHPDPDKHLAGMMTDWGSLLRDRHETDRALSVLKESVEMHRTLFGDESREYASALITLGPALQDNRELAAAESVYRKALDIRRRLAGDDHVDVGFALNNLAFVLVDKGDLEGAEAMFRQSLAIWRKTLGNDHPQVVSGFLNLAGIVQKRGKLDEAEKLLMDALAMNEKQAIPDPLRLSAIEHLLGRNMNLRRDPTRAEPYLREAIGLRKKLFPANHYVVAAVESELGKSLTMLKRYPEAEVALGNAYKSLTLSFGDSNARTQETLRLLKELYIAWGKKEKAEALTNKVM